MRLFKYIIIMSLPLVLKAAGSGGADIGGGGDGTPMAPVTVSQLRDAFENYRHHHIELLNALVYSGLVANRIESVQKENDKSVLSEPEWQRVKQQAAIYRKLFRDRDSKEVSETTPLIEYRETRDCTDRYGESKDGSVVAEKPYSMCFSLGRLQKKLTSSNYEIEVLALYLHESSHLLGADEEQASFIQSEVIAMGPNFKDQWTFLFRDKKKIVSNILDKIRRTTDQILNSTSKAKRCDLLSGINHDLHTLFIEHNVQRRNLVIEGWKTVAQIHYAMLVMDYSFDYCGFQSQQYTYHRQRFEMVPVKKVADLYPDPLNLMPYFGETQRLYYSQFFLADLKPGSVYLVNEDDLESLRKNLSLLAE